MVDEYQEVVDDNVLLEEILGRSLFEELIQSILEGFRDVVINGNEVIPPIDPLEIDSMGPFHFDITG